MPRRVNAMIGRRLLILKQCLWIRKRRPSVTSSWSSVRLGMAYRITRQVLETGTNSPRTAFPGLDYAGDEMHQSRAPNFVRSFSLPDDSGIWPQKKGRDICKDSSVDRIQCQMSDSNSRS